MSHTGEVDHFVYGAFGLNQTSICMDGTHQCTDLASTEETR